VLLAPFAKNALDITLFGITNDVGDVSVDTFRTVTLPFLRHIGLVEGVALEVIRRGAPPIGNGEVRFKCGVVKKIAPFTLSYVAPVKRVRGVAYTKGVAPQFALRMVDTARAVLNNFIPDVWIYTDNYKGERKTGSPGFGISLVAETLKGHLIGADMATGSHVLSNEPQMSRVSSSPDCKTDILSLVGMRSEDDDGSLTEQLTESELMGRMVARRLLLEISNGGIVDSTHQYLPIFFMALADEYKRSVVRLSTLTPFTIQFIRHIRDFLGVTYEFSEEKTVEAAPEGEDEEEVSFGDLTQRSVVVSCIGVGASNVSRKTF